MIGECVFFLRYEALSAEEDEQFQVELTKHFWSVLNISPFIMTFFLLLLSAMRKNPPAPLSQLKRRIGSGRQDLENGGVDLLLCIEDDKGRGYPGSDEDLLLSAMRKNPPAPLSQLKRA
jgi:hypothetical protein